MNARHSAMLLAAALGLWAGPARAESERPANVQKPSKEGDGGVMDSTAQGEWGYWGDQPSRWHASGQLSVGGPTSAQLNFAYGKPHWFWGGLTATALGTTEFAALRGGLQLNLLIVNLSVQLRRTQTFERRFPLRANSYTDSDLLDADRPRAEYTSLDSMLRGVVPAGPTLGVWSVYLETGFGIPEDAAVYSEFLRAVMDEPVAFQPQLGWYYRLLDDRLLIGPAVDAVLTSGRDSMVRVGGGVFYDLGDHLALQLLGTLPVTSPDPDLGWFKQSWGIAWLRWRWATGEPALGLL